MTLIVGSSNIKSASLQARIVRADGSIEDLGTIGYTSKNLLKRVLVNLLLPGKKRLLDNYYALRRRIKE